MIDDGYYSVPQEYSILILKGRVSQVYSAVEHCRVVVEQ
jgi:hypothetical protein